MFTLMGICGQMYLIGDKNPKNFIFFQQNLLFLGFDRDMFHEIRCVYESVKAAALQVFHQMRCKR